LKEAVSLHISPNRKGNVDWPKVAEFMNNGRTKQQCFRRWKNILQRCDDDQIRRGYWSPEEVI
jgi:hypothetical protein